MQSMSTINITANQLSQIPISEQTRDEIGIRDYTCIDFETLYDEIKSSPIIPGQCRTFPPAINATNHLTYFIKRNVRTSRAIIQNSNCVKYYNGNGIKTMKEIDMQVTLENHLIKKAKHEGENTISQEIQTNKKESLAIGNQFFENFFKGSDKKIHQAASEILTPKQSEVSWLTPQWIGTSLADLSTQMHEPSFFMNTSPITRAPPKHTTVLPLPLGHFLSNGDRAQLQQFYEETATYRDYEIRNTIEETQSDELEFHECQTTDSITVAEFNGATKISKANSTETLLKYISILAKNLLTLTEEIEHFYGVHNDIALALMKVYYKYISGDTAYKPREDIIVNTLRHIEEKIHCYIECLKRLGERIEINKQKIKIYNPDTQKLIPSATREFSRRDDTTWHMENCDYMDSFNYEVKELFWHDSHLGSGERSISDSNCSLGKRELIIEGMAPGQTKIRINGKQLQIMEFTPYQINHQQPKPLSSEQEEAARQLIEELKLPKEELTEYIMPDTIIMMMHIVPKMSILDEIDLLEEQINPDKCNMENKFIGKREASQNKYNELMLEIEQSQEKEVAKATKLIEQIIDQTTLGKSSMNKLSAEINFEQDPIYCDRMYRELRCNLDAIQRFNQKDKSISNPQGLHLMIGFPAIEAFNQECEIEDLVSNNFVNVLEDIENKHARHAYIYTEALVSNQYTKQITQAEKFIQNLIRYKENHRRIIHENDIIFWSIEGLTWLLTNPNKAHMHIIIQTEKSYNHDTQIKKKEQFKKALGQEKVTVDALRTPGIYNYIIKEQFIIGFTSQDTHPNNMPNQKRCFIKKYNTDSISNHASHEIWLKWEETISGIQTNQFKELCKWCDKKVAEGEIHTYFKKIGYDETLLKGSLHISPFKDFKQAQKELYDTISDQKNEVNTIYDRIQSQFILKTQLIIAMLNAKNCPSRQIYKILTAILDLFRILHNYCGFESITNYLAHILKHKDPQRRSFLIISGSSKSGKSWTITRLCTSIGFLAKNRTNNLDRMEGNNRTPIRIHDEMRFFLKDQCKETAASDLLLNYETFHTSERALYQSSTINSMLFLFFAKVEAPKEIYDYDTYGKAKDLLKTRYNRATYQEWDSQISNRVHFCNFDEMDINHIKKIFPTTLCRNMGNEVLHEAINIRYQAIFDNTLTPAERNHEVLYLISEIDERTFNEELLWLKAGDSMLCEDAKRGLKLSCVIEEYFYSYMWTIALDEARK